MTPAAILRAAACDLEAACALVRTLPPRAVDDESAMTLFFDAPRVILALAVIAGTLDPAGEPEPEPELPNGLSPLPVFPVRSA